MFVGPPCFIHDRYLLKSDLGIIGDTSVTQRDALKMNLEWHNDSEVAWCPMVTHTYMRNLQGVCTILPKVYRARYKHNAMYAHTCTTIELPCAQIGQENDQFMTVVAHCSNHRDHPNTFFFRHTVDESGTEIRGLEPREHDSLYLE